MLVIPSCSYASAYGFDIKYYIRGADSGEMSGVKRGFSGSLGDSDGYDHETQLPSLPGVCAGFWKVNSIEGWDGTTGLYTWDRRAALTEGERKTEDIFVWAAPGTQSQDILVAASMSLAQGVNYRLSLVNIPNGVTYIGPREWGPDDGTITLPFYDTDDPLTGYKFLAEVTAVPEPSSILTLAGGLAGLGGLALKRRKK